MGSFTEGENGLTAATAKAKADALAGKVRSADASTLSRDFMELLKAEVASNSVIAGQVKVTAVTVHQDEVTVEQQEITVVTPVASSESSDDSDSSMIIIIVCSVVGGLLLLGGVGLVVLGLGKKKTSGDRAEPGNTAEPETEKTPTAATVTKPSTNVEKPAEATQI